MLYQLDQDEYGTVINGEQTYDGLTGILIAHHPAIIAWTDEAGTQLDILLAYSPAQYGSLQRGMSSDTDLFVAVSNCGMFGFELNGSEKFPGYVGEKLHLGGENDSTVKLAELINAVCRRLEAKRSKQNV